MKAYGFLNVELNEHFTNLHDVIPSAEDIAYLGNEQLINGDKWRFLEHSLLHDGIYVGWHIGDMFREGTYGKIYKALRMVVKRRKDTLFDVLELPEDVIVKSTEPTPGDTILPPGDVTAHTSEALLHVLAWQTIQTTATPWGIPRPYEVFGDRCTGGWKSMSFCMSYVNGRVLHSFIQKYWKTTTKTENSQSFVQILAQIAYILYHLQDTLRLNHRDIKVNNVMIRKAPQQVTLEIDGASVSTEYEITVIDFGFACVGFSPPKDPTTVFQAGSWFPMGEICCKLGRDIAQLIYCIHCYFPIDKYLLPEIADIVRAWMKVETSSGITDMLNGFNKEGVPLRKAHPEYHTGIYEFLRRPDVDPELCAPLTIFKACQSLNSSFTYHTRE